MDKGLKKEIFEWIKAIAFAFILALFIRGYVFEPMIVPTGSMIHTIEIDDRILVNKFIYRFQEPKLNDIVVFSTGQPKGNFVKRLIVWAEIQ